IEARQGFARFMRSTRFAGLGLRDPGFCHFGLRPAAPAASLDVAVGITLVDQTAGLVAVTQRRLEQFAAEASRRAASDAFKSLQQPDPFGLVPGFDADRLYLRPVILEIFAEHLLLLVVEVGEEQREEIAGTV